MSLCSICNEQHSTANTCGHAFESASVVVGTVSSSDELLQTCSGLLNGKEVVLFHSDCTAVGVRKSLVTPDQLTGEVRHCRQFSIESIQFLVAHVSLHTPYFSGEVDACVVENPVSDLALGRAPGVTFQCIETAE